MIVDGYSHCGSAGGSTGLRRSRLPEKPGLDPEEARFESEVRSQE